MISKFTHDEDEIDADILEEVDARIGYLTAQVSRDMEIDEEVFTLSFVVDCAKDARIPATQHTCDGFYFRLTIFSTNGDLRYSPVETEVVDINYGNPIFNNLIVLRNVMNSDILKLSLNATFVKGTSWKKLGRTLISVKELREKKSWPEMWLFDKRSVPLFNKTLDKPTVLSIDHVKVTDVSDNCKSHPAKLMVGISKRHLTETDSGTMVADGEIFPNTRVLRTNPNLEGIDESLPGEQDDVESSETDSNESTSDITADATSVSLQEKGDAKHMLVLTRGTRGDVQPFIALARGLAELHGWTVSISTELRYKPMIEKYSKVSRGAIRYYPSGGDTEARIERPVAKWAVSSKSTLIHAAMLARTEREFFDSEPSFYYWAKRLEPDLICYTFTTVNLAMIISEAMKIPMIGFFLQPTVLPSHQYPALSPLKYEDVQNAGNQLETSDLEGHKAFRWIKRQMENNVFTHRLKEMRRRRGLDPHSRYDNDFQRIRERNFPVICPIDPTLFGGKPSDWPKEAHLTTQIFLRGSAVPELSPDVEAFITGAKEKGFPLVVICFSSMPVSRIKILESALLMLDKCPGPHKPAIFALIGNRSAGEATNADQEARASEYIHDGRLFIAKGAPFSKLFPRMDFIILHGGLGTTAECLAAGVPGMVTGVLLMDQRFWGHRLHCLGVGPPPCHISDFNKTILKILPEALNPDGEWRKRAKELRDEVFPGGMSDGVAENTEMFIKMSKIAFAAPGKEPA
eukprot:CAMPEP_0203751268 /NCGR_PEP_ID=MMETSP0098-20131031/5363_1 /ASSEMBLY_ACC=CAM_ASM_000208 /TAXON_ID=96639 /ORGANISM=" , Strain NY0313808BC1" /LENGTH=743 /DNA_ID=CAMNT_0050640903 /DNA_START=507 /DNA_END=2738 /DNA_ORIENTATION=+